MLEFKAPVHAQVDPTASTTLRRLPTTPHFGKLLAGRDLYRSDTACIDVYGRGAEKLGSPDRKQRYTIEEQGSMSADTARSNKHDIEEIGQMLHDLPYALALPFPHFFGESFLLGIRMWKETSLASGQHTWVPGLIITQYAERKCPLLMPGTRRDPDDIMMQIRAFHALPAPYEALRSLNAQLGCILTYACLHRRNWPWQMQRVQRAFCSIDFDSTLMLPPTKPHPHELADFPPDLYLRRMVERGFIAREDTVFEFDQKRWQKVKS